MSIVGWSLVVASLSIQSWQRAQTLVIFFFEKISWGLKKSCAVDCAQRSGEVAPPNMTSQVDTDQRSRKRSNAEHDFFTVSDLCRPHKIIRQNKDAENDNTTTQRHLTPHGSGTCFITMAEQWRVGRVHPR